MGGFGWDFGRLAVGHVLTTEAGWEQACHFTLARCSCFAWFTFSPISPLFFLLGLILLEGEALYSRSSPNTPRQSSSASRTRPSFQFSFSLFHLANHRPGSSPFTNQHTKPHKLVCPRICGTNRLHFLITFGHPAISPSALARAHLPTCLPHPHQLLRPSPGPVRAHE